MQTFLPYLNFTKSAAALDNKRLGKQRVECVQIYGALMGRRIVVLLGIDEPRESEWRFHPAVKMWRGYEDALLFYGHTICEEWRGRGFQDSMLPWFEEELGKKLQHPVRYPSWLGDGTFHRSHQSNLIRKNPAFYGKLFPGVPDNLPYVWPTP